jgi:tryptophan synthase alpha chain
MQQSLPASLSDRVNLLKKTTPLPVCVGFGISNAAQAGEVAKLADGVVVGSAIVDRIGQMGRSPKLAAEVASFLRPLAQAVHSA